MAMSGHYGVRFVHSEIGGLIPLSQVVSWRVVITAQFLLIARKKINTKDKAKEYENATIQYHGGNA